MAVMSYQIARFYAQTAAALDHSLRPFDTNGRALESLQATELDISTKSGVLANTTLDLCVCRVSKPLGVRLLLLPHSVLGKADLYLSRSNMLAFLAKS